jgi:(Z)-2-((N-methylformamido)methylene)-5-hydroxybutyrolactone dehydrogenase
MAQALSKTLDYGLYIGGKHVQPEGAPRLPVNNPATGEQWATIVNARAQDVDKAVGAARAAFDNTWSRTSPAARARLLNRLADVIEARARELAEIEVQDNGKLLREMYAQLKAIPGWYRYYAGLADKIQGSTIPHERPSLFNYTVREPYGVIGCITPWNSPLLLGSFTLAPALAAGNTVVVKPSEHASVSTLELARCFEEAGFPPGVFNVVTGLGLPAGDALARHKGIGVVVFTGSGQAGASVAAAAVGHFAEVVLELGGKSPNIIFEDAPLDAAVSGILSGIFAASGQTCIAGSRVLVQRPVYNQVLERLEARARKIRLGNPLADETEMGPIANEPQYRKVLSYFDVARADGARVVMGARAADGAELQRGLYVEPTILADVRNDMRIAREEVFGPVLSLIPFEYVDEAIAIANDTEYGLASGVWTTNLSLAHQVARRLQAGTVWINTYRALAPTMPFGGYKSSGLGRENGLEAMHEFTQVKSVWIETEPSAGDPFSIKL